MTVTFKAPCPECGGDCDWQQAGDIALPDNFTVDCPCDG